MGDIVELLYKMRGDDEGLNNYVANRDYDSAVKDNNYLREQTDPNSLLNTGIFGVGSFFSYPLEDFAGVSNFENLKAAIKDYSGRVQEIVEKYDEKAKLDATFKGKAGEELHSFVVATKTLLKAYVQLVEKWNEELDDAYERYQQGDIQLQQNVASDAQAVEQAAQNVSLG